MYIYICLHVNYICSLCLLFSMGLFLWRRKRGNQDMGFGLDMYSFYTCSPWPLCQRILCLLRPSCIGCTQRWSVGHWTEVKPALTVFQPSEENKTKLPSNKLGHAGPSRVTTTHVLPTTAMGTHDTLKLYSRFSWLGDIVLSWISK